MNPQTSRSCSSFTAGDLKQTFWESLRSALDGAESIAWDLGFFGQPSQPLPAAGAPVIAVGHSFGLLWLLHHRPIAWRALIAINGFPRFAKAPDFPDGIAPRQIDRMQSGLTKDPARVAKRFSGALWRGGDSGRPDVVPLSRALDGLLTWDQRPAPVDLALCGLADPIVPPP